MIVDNMKNFVSYIWQLPQILLGLILSGFYYILDSKSYSKTSFKDVTLVRSKRINGGISLGCFIMINYYNSSNRDLNHEYGHCRQSRLLGPFYLLIIGLPSLIHATARTICWKLFHKKWNYYKFYTEAWADKLGGVQR